MYAKRYNGRGASEAAQRTGIWGLLYALPAVLLIFVFYFYQGNKLSLIQVPYLEKILKFIMGS